MEKVLSNGSKMIITLAAVILSHITFMIHVYDLFMSCERFEAPVFSISIVLLMLTACLMNFKNVSKRPIAIVSLLILLFAGAYWASGIINQFSNGFRIMINNSNAIKQIYRIIIISSLILMPICASVSRIGSLLFKK